MLGFVEKEEAHRFLLNLQAFLNCSKKPLRSKNGIEK